MVVFYFSSARISADSSSSPTGSATSMITLMAQIIYFELEVFLVVLSPRR